MKTTVAELERRVAALSPDFEEHVISWHGNLAKVKSFSSHGKVWDVSIMMGTGEGERRVTCTCPSKLLCKHMVSFYAVAKKLSPSSTVKDTVEPNEAKETPPEPSREGLKMIASAIEMLVNGIGLLVDERMKERMKEE